MKANRLLIVEDDQSILDTIALNLKYVGYDCNICSDGKGAADHLDKDHSYYYFTIKKNIFRM